MGGRAVVLGILVAALPWPAACSTTETFACSSDMQCVDDGAAGRCEPEGVCSFPDDTCPSGHRYGGLAGALSGECVGEGSTGHATTDPGMTSIDATRGLDGSSTGPEATSSTTKATTEPVTTEPVTTEPATTEPVTTTDPGTTTGGGPDPYGPCVEPEDCSDPDSSCVLNTDGASVCAPPCVGDDRCPQVPDFGANVLCAEITADTMGCMIACNPDDPAGCPDGMSCQQVRGFAFGYCAWSDNGS
jgi:hypothetical protein